MSFRDCIDLSSPSCVVFYGSDPIVTMLVTSLYAKNVEIL